jgi:hypothetical protein
MTGLAPGQKRQSVLVVSTCLPLLQVLVKSASLIGSATKYTYRISLIVVADPAQVPVGEMPEVKFNC